MALSRRSQCVANARAASTIGAHHAYLARITPHATPPIHLDHAAGDEIHRDRQRRAGHSEVEVARDGEVAGELRILEVPMPAGARSLGELVVEPCGSAVAEVGAERLMNRTEHLKQHEDRAGKREPTGERTAALHGATSTPIATANAAGRIPLSRRTVHQAAARPGSAFGRTPKNFHSLRSVSDWSTTAFCHRTVRRTGSAAHARPSDCR